MSWVLRMNTPSNPLCIQVFVKDDEHFEQMNDFICFNRRKVKSFEWYHGFIGDPVGSHVTIEFYNATDALIFKLQNG